MLTMLLSVNISGKIAGALAILGATFALLIPPGPVNIETELVLYENEQWSARQVIEISPTVLQPLDAGADNVSTLNGQITALQVAADDPELNFTLNQQTREDGWRVITAAGTGQGLDRLNQIFFSGQATIKAGTSGVSNSREISVFWSNLDPIALVGTSGRNILRISGFQIFESNADQFQQVGGIVIWENPLEVSVRLTALAGSPSSLSLAAPAVASAGGAAAPAQQEPAVIDLIRNGGFEEPWQQQDGVAPEWTGYDNGHAHFGWYEELWPEAVRSGERAQLMEIFEVEANFLDRVMAIHQTVDVVPNSEYDLTLYAMLRTDADIVFRNQAEYEMYWGVDPFGEGNYDNVQNWVLMPLEEQNRLGSHAPFPEDIPLVYEMITGTITTGPDTNRITLFIRGLKKFPTNVEINMDVDDVSLVGPRPGAPQAMAAAPASEPAAAPAAEDKNLPTSGAMLSPSASLGMVLLGGLVLIVLGTAASVRLLGYKP